MVVGEFIRDSLLKLEVGDTVNLPGHMRAAVQKEMAELAMFDDRLYKSKIDKARGEIEVERVK